MPDESLNLNQILAEDIMSEGVVSVKPDMLLGQVAHLMLRDRVSGVPVLDNDQRIVGIVTLTDFFILLDKISQDLPGEGDDARSKTLHSVLEQTKNLPVSAIMSKTIVSISPKMTLKEILDIVIKWQTHTLPVMSDGKVVGVIGRHDILNAIYVYG
ncbi:MAG: CBS domain-containing protein [Candidatus Omnitrophica bacterium]|nr:CBS domain-containing protein [Candidatus Omnitrophota bacterium]